jgi:hypothetical protein
MWLHIGGVHHSAKDRLADVGIFLFILFIILLVGLGALASSQYLRYFSWN